MENGGRGDETPERPSRIERPERKSTAELLKVWGPLLALVAIGFGIAIAKLEPPPPRSLKIAAGAQGGAYYAFSERYREALAREGFDLEVLETAGSVENHRLLLAGEVDLALLQGGAPAPNPGDQAGPLRSLASLFFEPIWLFFRADQPIEQLTDLVGKRIAIGSEGSGIRALTLQLLEANGIGAADAELMSISSLEAAAALEQGTLDAAFFVSSAGASYIPRLAARTDIELLSVRRSLAYRKSYPFLSRVLLGEGALDLEENLPEEDISLLAAAASLVTREDLHHALVPLLLSTMDETHGGIGLFSAAGTFPSKDYVTFPLTAEARHYLEHGPSFLQRYLGFRLATAIDRLKILLLPLITLMFPVLKAAPPIYRWRIRSKIYRWYEDLSWADEILYEQPSEKEIRIHIQAVRELEHEVAQVSVPLSYMDEYYNLRMHIQLIRSKLEQLSSEQGIEDA